MYCASAEFTASLVVEMTNEVNERYKKLIREWNLKKSGKKPDYHQISFNVVTGNGFTGSQIGEMCGKIEGEKRRRKKLQEQ